MTEHRRKRPFEVPCYIAGLTWLLPGLAHAESSDAAEIGHAIWIIGIFSIFFISTMSFMIWLLITRLREGKSVPEAAPSYSNLESVWSRDRALTSTAPLAAEADSKLATSAKEDFG